MKKSFPLLFLMLIFSVFTLSCQQNSTNNAESGTASSQRETDLQKIDTAKKLIYGSKESPSNLDKALEILRTIPPDSRSYTVATSMIKGIETQKNDAKTPQQPAEQQVEQKNSAKPANQKDDAKSANQKDTAKPAKQN